MKNLIILLLTITAFSACTKKVNQTDNTVLIVDFTDSNKLLNQLSSNIISKLVTPENDHDGLQFCLCVVGDKKHIAGYSSSLSPVLDEWDFNEFQRRKDVQVFQKNSVRAVVESLKQREDNATHSYVFYNLTEAVKSCRNNSYVKNEIHIISDLRNKCEILDSYKEQNLFQDQKKFMEFMDEHYPIGKALGLHKIKIHFYFQSYSRSEDQAYDEILKALMAYCQQKGIATFAHTSFSNLN